jgi:hypothetical protein
MSDKWIVIFGNLARGIDGAEGPFDTETEAQEYAAAQQEWYKNGDQQWVRVPLEPPNPDHEDRD